MKRILLLLTLLYIIMSGICTAGIKENEYKWEYVFSEIPYSYYVDMNPNHMIEPTKDIFVFYAGQLNSKKNIFIAYQWAIKANSDGTLENRIEKSEAINVKTKKIIWHNNTSTEWEKMKYNSPINKCLKYLYKHKK